MVLFRITGCEQSTMIQRVKTEYDVKQQNHWSHSYASILYELANQLQAERVGRGLISMIKVNLWSGGEGGQTEIFGCSQQVWAVFPSVFYSLQYDGFKL